MKIKSFKPDERLTTAVFDPRLENSGQISKGIYTCGTCGNNIRFCSWDFKKHYGSEISCFDSETEKQFLSFREINQLHQESFLDFECPACRLKIRFIFRVFEFAMAAYYYEVTEILEGQ